MLAALCVLLAPRLLRHEHPTSRRGPRYRSDPPTSHNENVG
jgi:hypothetical protein